MVLFSCNSLRNMTVGCSVYAEKCMILKGMGAVLNILSTDSYLLVFIVCLTVESALLCVCAHTDSTDLDLIS